MLELQGSYFLKVDFGGQNVPINSQNLKELTIIQDLNSFLPEFRMQIVDPQGALTHLLPFDRGMSRLSIQLDKSSKTTSPEFYNDFDFAVFRRQPEGLFGTSANYDVRGLLDVEGMFAPTLSRAFNQSIKLTLSQIATELGCDSTEISGSLDYNKLVIQPSCSIMELFSDLKDRLIGGNGEGAVQIFLKRVFGKTVLVAKPIEDLVMGPIAYKFIVNDKPVQDHFPVFKYEIMDNYKLFGVFGSRQQPYSYYDYENSRFTRATEDATSFYSMADYFAIDNSDTINGDNIQNTGRSNDFTSNFQNKVRANYYKRLSGLVKMWIVTWGLPNIAPGDMVKVLFAQGYETGALQRYQYSGYWMVQRVVQQLGDTHRTRLLLTRNGVDTDADTSLLKATRKKTK